VSELTADDDPAGRTGGPELRERIAAARVLFADNTRRLELSRSLLRDTRKQLASGRSRRQQLHDSALARMKARLDTMPVIEQAKGILMSQNGCDADAAFGMLRRASQRSNIRVSVLAAEIVQRTADGQGRGDHQAAGQPSCPGGCSGPDPGSRGAVSITRMTPRVVPAPTSGLRFTVHSTGRPRRFTTG
jgi:ANTAR domain-containing protein